MDGLEPKIENIVNWGLNKVSKIVKTFTISLEFSIVFVVKNFSIIEFLLYIICVFLCIIYTYMCRYKAKPRLHYLFEVN